MSTYSYTLLEGIPASPLIKIQLSTPSVTRSETVECTGLLDTGSDCTLVPFTFLLQVRAQIAGTRMNIAGVGEGRRTIVVPYYVDVVFDSYTFPFFRVYGCPEQDTGGIVIIGRDLMNQCCIEFNGPELTFTIS